MEMKVVIDFSERAYSVLEKLLNGAPIAPAQVIPINSEVKILSEMKAAEPDPVLTAMQLRADKAAPEKKTRGGKTVTLPEIVEAEKEEQQTPPQEKAAPGEVVTMDNVRKKVIALAQDGKQAEIRGVLEKYGVRKAPELAGKPELQFFYDDICKIA